MIFLSKFLYISQIFLQKFPEIFFKFFHNFLFLHGWTEKSKDLRCTEYRNSSIYPKPASLEHLGMIIRHCLARQLTEMEIEDSRNNEFIASKCRSK